jgi:hypothetical protein
MSFQRTSSGIRPQAVANGGLGSTRALCTGQPTAVSCALVAGRKPRQRGPLGEQLTGAELEPIRVHTEGGTWLVDYGSYVQGHHGSREDAIEAALTAVWENRELSIERPRRISETGLRLADPRLRDAEL